MDFYQQLYICGFWAPCNSFLTKRGQFGTAMKRGQFGTLDNWHHRGKQTSAEMAIGYGVCAEAP